MALQFSTTIRNGRADSIESGIGTAPILKIRSDPSTPVDRGWRRCTKKTNAQQIIHNITSRTRG